MKDTIILFDNTEDDKSVGKIKGSYDDVLIGYMTLIYQTAIKTKKKPMTLIYQTAIKTKKKPEDVVLDILYKVKDNKKTLYKYIKKNKENKK